MRNDSIVAALVLAVGAGLSHAPANSGYNADIQNGTFNDNGISGAFKSTNGGVDRQAIWPPADTALSQVVQYNFVGHLVIDPTDTQHRLVSFHASCAAPHSNACFAESGNAGATWQIIDGLSQWVGGEGQAVYFLDTSTTWLFASQSNGLCQAKRSHSFVLAFIS
jgi:hypothetical protein